MVWERKGLLLPAPLPVAWAVSHAALPHAHALTDGSARIYFSSRDEHGRSHIGRADLDLARPSEARIAPEPLLRPGPLGAFDDSGVTTSCLVHDGERQLLYYTGWSLGRTVPFYLFVGCALSKDGGETFTRVSAGPILDRDEVDPYLVASPWILVEDGLWRMWYVSATGWRLVNGAPQHCYHIKYAESRDGLAWRRSGVGTGCGSRPAATRTASARPSPSTEFGGNVWTPASMQRARGTPRCRRTRRSTTTAQAATSSTTATATAGPGSAGRR